MSSGAMGSGTTGGQQITLLTLTVRGTPVGQSIPLTIDPSAKRINVDTASIPHITFMLSMSMGRGYINGQDFDVNPLTVMSTLGTYEVWTIVNQSGMDHPFHQHTDAAQVLSVSGGDSVYAKSVYEDSRNERRDDRPENGNDPVARPSYGLGGNGYVQLSNSQARRNRHDGDVASNENVLIQEVILYVKAFGECRISHFSSERVRLKLCANDALVFMQPPNQNGGYFQSSSNGSDYDPFVWDNFTLPTAAAISEITWHSRESFPGRCLCRGAVGGESSDCKNVCSTSPEAKERLI